MWICRYPQNVLLSLAIALIKAGPLSETITKGGPNMQNTFLLRALRVSSAVELVVGMNRVNLVRAQVTINIY